MHDLLKYLKKKKKRRLYFYKQKHLKTISKINIYNKKKLLAHILKL